MEQMRSKWPRGLRIDRGNDHLASLPESHPARRLVIAHAECWRDCAGREIADWRGAAVDAEWFSALEGKRKSLSGVVYEYICFDLIIEPSLKVEVDVVPHLNHLETLLSECKTACARNEAVLAMVEQLQRYCLLWRVFVAHHTPA